MNRHIIYIRQIILIITLCVLICGWTNSQKEDLIRILILSGKNNHEWQKTTPVLVKMYKDSKLFVTKVTERPDTLTYKTLNDYDVVVSNWNTWPDNDFRMPESWEADFLRYVEEGGGVLFFHSGASSFYSWNEYHQIGIGRWGKETNHDVPAKGRVFGFDQTHPVTKGLRDFFIVDEIWEKAEIWKDAKPLASVSATNRKDGHLISEKAVFVNQFGKGRSFFTILGHNEKALLNTGLQTLLLRASQWTAQREVTIEAPSCLKETTSGEGDSYRWEQSDSTLGLMKNSDKIWQFNFSNRYGKPYFHPVSVNSSPLTCVSPLDHPWHLGLWFSWKYINGINYWEYLDNFKSDDTGYRSEGITETKKTEIIRNPDYSANISMEFLYLPANGDPVMTEKRNMFISPLLKDGSYFIDHENIFNPAADEVILDRTPIQGETEGQSWGGYAGLSIRFNQDYTSPDIIVPTPTESNIYKKNDWLYMGFNTLTGDTAGMCILQNPKFTTMSTSWYIISNPEVPFYYFSPAVLFDGKIILKKGESLHLKYRVWMLPGKTGKDELQKKFDEYLNNSN